jgi:DNA polymerase-3 subunit gamma/tau
MNLYNKYKPQTLSEIKGQDFILNVINALLDDLPNGLIVSGPFGVGKTLLLTLIAKTINCLNREKNNINCCNNCENCTMIHVDDIMEIDAATHSGVDSIRQVIESVNYMPMYFKYKVYIIDEAHMLSQSAFDALLLTLHELPDNVKFFFATTKFYKIPETIVSRCLVLQLERINPSILKSEIQRILIAENKQLSDQSIDLIIKTSNGSMRQCLSTLQLSILAGNNEQLLEKYLRTLNPEKIMEIFINILDGEPNKALNLWQTYYNLGYDERLFMDELMNIVCNLTKCKLKIKTDKIYEELMEKYDLSMELLANYWDILITQMEGLYTNCKYIVESTIMMLVTILDRSGLAKYIQKGVVI